MINRFIFTFISIGMLACSLLPASGLNRPDYKHKQELPPLPSQTADYINIVNYNIRYDYPSRVEQDSAKKRNDDEEDAWQKRQEYYFASLNLEDEAARVLSHMQKQLRDSLSTHLQLEGGSPVKDHDPFCQTCKYSQDEPYPILESRFFRIALKTVKDAKSVVYGNFPYPYRLIIALKRHAAKPNEEEWLELRQILQVLESQVRDDLGADYTSYSFLQDVYYRHQHQGKPVASEPHFFLHFIFRFPRGTEVLGIPFEDPNPHFQFNLHEPNLVKEGVPKPRSDFIFKRGADIITTQELTHLQAGDMRERLPLHKFVGYTAFDGRPMEDVGPNDWIGELVAIAYRSDRFHCLEHGVRWLSKTPEKPSAPEGSSRNRIIVWAKLRDLTTGHSFYIFNSHYDHMGAQREMVDAEAKTISSVAKGELWFATGERFYKAHQGEELYRYYQATLPCHDVRDNSLMGHYGEAGTWGGFAKDPFAAKVKEGNFECDTLDVFFTNTQKNQILLSYHFNGAYDPRRKELYPFNAPVQDGYRLASDHFMSGIYVKLEN